jgi:flagellar hook protein FlgE
MGFSQALSGLKSQALNLGVVGNNIANSQTVGFKGSRALFADVFAGAQVGLGTRVSQVQQDFSSGNLESSSRDLDIAVGGEGFLRFLQDNQVVYSRNGQLNIDAEGFLTNAQGAVLTGFPGGSGPGATPVALQVPADGMPSSPTSLVETSLNLDARSPEIDRLTVPFDPSDANTYSFASNVTSYDSLGNPRNVSVFYTKTAPNTWEVNTAINGVAAAATGTIDFTNNGILNTQAGLGSMLFTLAPGIDDLDIELDFTGSTQFGNDFSLSAVDQNGNTSGSLVGVSIDKEGNLVGSYSNEEKQVLGTIALANFTNKEGLRPAGDNAWFESSESGQPLVGAPGQGLFGGIESGVVETSNVDLASELVKMIIAQRAYQANSQTIKAEDEVLQTTINLS